MHVYATACQLLLRLKIYGFKNDTETYINTLTMTIISDDENWVKLSNYSNYSNVFFFASFGSEM